MHPTGMHSCYLSCSTGFEPVNLSLFYSRSRIVQIKGCQSQSGGNEAPFEKKDSTTIWAKWSAAVIMA